MRRLRLALGGGGKASNVETLELTHGGYSMPRIFPYRTYTNKEPTLIKNCVYCNDGIIAENTSEEASLLLDEPTYHYKTGDIEYPDQIWIWVPPAMSWLRNRDRVLRPGDDENEEVYRYVALWAELSQQRGRNVPQGEINEHITQNSMWDSFPNMRSMNLHNPALESIPGITPTHYSMISRLGVGHGSGHPLTDYKRY
jgi:hypothetical protein